MRLDVDLHRQLIWALRRLRRRPAYFGASALIFCLAIGAGSALFTVTDVLLMTPLPYPDPGSLVVIQKRDAATGRAVGVSPAELLGLREAVGSLAEIGGVRYGMAVVEGTQTPLRVVTAQVTPNLLRLLGIRPLAGTLPGGQAQDFVLVIEPFWRSYLGGGDLASAQLRVRDFSHQVQGAIPEPMLGPPGTPKPDLLLKLDLRSAMQGKDLVLVARTPQPSAIEPLRQRLQALSAQETSAADEGIEFEVTRLGDYSLGAFAVLFSRLAWTLLIFILASIVNIGALNLARNLQNRRSFAIQLALGASRARLGASVFLEAGACAAAGLAGGLILAEWLLRGVAASAGDWLPAASSISLDLSLEFVAAAALVTFLAALAGSLLPFWSVSSACQGDLVRSDSRAARWPQSTRIRSLFAALQVAFGLPILIGAGLLLASLWHLTNLELGHDTSSWVFKIELPQQGNPADQIRTKRSFWRQLLKAAESLPNIQSVGISTNIPLRGGPIMSDFEMLGSHAGLSAKAPDSGLRVRFDTATSDYFRAMGMHLVSGSPLSASPQPSPLKEAVVNERFVQDFLQGKDPIGLRIAVFGQEAEVRGVVADTYVWSPQVQPSPEIFVHAFQNDIWVGRYLTVKTTTENPSEVVSMIRSTVNQLRPGQPVSEVISMQEVWAELVAKPKLAAKVTALFAISFLILSLAGIYSVLAAVVSHRRGEIGVRMAVGASRPKIFVTFLLTGAKTAAAGVILGLVLARVGSSLLEDQLFGVSSLEPSIFIGAALLVFTAGVAATVGPALSASRLDANQILNSDG